MSVPMVGVPRARLPWRERAAARVAVAVARPLSVLPPARLSRILRLAGRNARPAGAAQTARARAAVVAASVRCAGHGCLQRSIATALLCRASGTWPDWCAGVRSRPFRAHAWVEAEGAAIGEPEDISGYRIVLAVRASAT